MARCQNRNCKTLSDVQLSYTTPTTWPAIRHKHSFCLDLSIDGTEPIAQSTPHTSFVYSTDPTTAHDTSRRRMLVRARVTAVAEPNEPPVTPLPRRRVPVVYSPEVVFGRLVIDEGTNVPAPSNATSTTELDISWLNEQQERLTFPPAPPSKD